MSSLVSWKKSILGDIYVPAHLSLTIVPGTEVEVYQSSDKRNSIVVDGSLTVGGIGEQVVLRGVLEHAGSWGGLFVSGTTTIQNVLIQHAERGLAVVNGASASVWETVFKENSVGVHAYNSHLEIHQSTFKDNVLYGIKEDAGANPVVVECLFSGNRFDYYDQELTNISIEELNGLGTNQGNLSQSSDKR